MKIKELRKSYKLTQKEIAINLNINQNTYSNYEKPTRKPDIDTLVKIADFYNVSLDYLCEREFNHNGLKLGILTPEQEQTITLIPKLSPRNLVKANGYVLGLLATQGD